MIQITQDQYDKLLDQRQKLAALEEAGVDRWEHYEDALRPLHNRKMYHEFAGKRMSDLLSFRSDEREALTRFKDAVIECYEEAKRLNVELCKSLNS